MTPSALEQFRAEFTARRAEANQDRRDTVIALQKSLAREQKAIDGCLRAIREDHATASIYAMLEAAEDAKAQIEAELASWGSSDAEISVDIAELYQAQIDALSETLSNPKIVHRASEILADLIERITVFHDPDLGHRVQIDGKLLGLLSFAEHREAADFVASDCSLKLVAGAGFEPATFRL
jgi:site-specific DNA recombinase